jgi:hypothetical protein
MSLLGAFVVKHPGICAVNVRNRLLSGQLGMVLMAIPQTITSLCVLLVIPDMTESIVTVLVVSLMTVTVIM